jgi:hypothetical protein
MCVSSISVAQKKARLNSDEELAKKIISNSELSELLKYNPNIQYFLTTESGDLKSGPRGLATYLHETVHIYDNIKSAGMNGTRYYWFDSSTLLSLQICTGIVTSDSIINTLPPFIQQKAMTKTYVTCMNDCFSKTYGIYGLLEEFNAYSIEATALLKLYPSFDTCRDLNTRKFWDGYLKTKYDCELSFYYFELFLSAYINYIDTNQHDSFLVLSNDSKFRSVFKKLFSRYKCDLQKLDLIEKLILKKQSYTKYGIKKYKYPLQTELASLNSFCGKEIKKSLGDFVD